MKQMYQQYITKPIEETLSKFYIIPIITILNFQSAELISSAPPETRPTEILSTNPLRTSYDSSTTSSETPATSMLRRSSGSLGSLPHPSWMPDNASTVRLIKSQRKILRSFSCRNVLSVM